MNEQKTRTALGTILYQSKIIQKEDIDRALEEQKQSGCLFGEALIKLDIVSEEDVGWGLANQLNIPFIHLSNARVDPTAVALVPEALARRHNAVPFLLIEDELTLVVADPTNQSTRTEIEAVTGRKVNLGIGLKEEIERVLEQVYGRDGSVPSYEISSDAWSRAEMAEMQADGTGMAFIASLLAYADGQGATSVHMVPDAQGSRVRLRANGGLKDVAKLSHAWSTVLIARLKSLAGLREEERFMEGRIELDSAERRLNFHLNLLKTPVGVAATLINLSPSRFPREITDLGLKRAEVNKLKALNLKRRGLLIVTGPDTLDKYRLVNLLAKSRMRPAEMNMAVGRFPVTPPEGFLTIPPREDEGSPSSTIQAVLDQGPDLLLVDNLSDRGALRVCLHASLSGCSLISTLSFPDASSCLEYLIEVTDSRTLLSYALIGVIAVANVGSTVPADSKPVPESTARRILKLDRLPEGAKVLRRGKGSKPAGAAGRLVIEVLTVDQVLAEALKRGASGRELKDLLAKAGHAGLKETVLQLVLAGEIPLDELEVLSVDLS